MTLTLQRDSLIMYNIFSYGIVRSNTNVYDCTNAFLEEDVGKSAEKIDEQRRKTLAYEYLCYLEGAKK